MDGAFAWFNRLIEAFYLLFPRIVIVRATHGGVKWVRGSRVLPLKPGLHIYWPLTTEIEVIVTARQTLALPVQVLTTQDGHKVVAGTVVVYKIRDVEQAIGKTNWDVDTTLNDITQAAVGRVMATHSYVDILKGVTDASLTMSLTREVRRELRQFGVYVCRCKLVDFAECKVYKVVGDAPRHLTP